MKGSRRILVRQWRLLLALNASQHGLTVPQLERQTETSRSTVYRDLADLTAAGAPITSERINGEARHRLLRKQELPDIGFSALQIAALHLARTALEPLAGTGLVSELDALLASLRPPKRQTSFRFPEPPPGRPDILRAIERAQQGRWRARIEYRAASRGGKPTRVHIEPLLLNVADSEPYVRAYCVERGAERTYKVRRIAAVHVTDEPATYRPPQPPEGAFENSVKVWTGNATQVAVRLDANVAWLAEEYPLVANQAVTTLPDGAVRIEARVSGIVEAARWVLGWGGAAEALEPSSLRRAVRDELATALGKYGGPGPAKGGRGKTTGEKPSRLTRAGTRGG